MAADGKLHHVWGAIQAFASVYCAAWATWAYYHPYNPRPSTFAQPTDTARVAMPFPLYIGILILAASVGIPAIVRLVFALHQRRRPTERDVLPRVNPANDEQVRALNAERVEIIRKMEVQHTAELLRAQESRRLCDEERRAAIQRAEEADARLKLFPPLQTEIISIIRGLRDLEVVLGKPPELQNTGPVPKDANQQIWMSDRLREATLWTADRAEWERKFIGGYRDRFADRIKRLSDSLMRDHGCVVAPLEPYSTTISSKADSDDLIEILLKYFVFLENPEPVRKRERAWIPIPPTPQRGLLSPLQAEVLALAQELRDFAGEMGEEPQLNSSDYPNTASGQLEFMQINSKLLHERQLEWSGKYNTRFDDKLKRLVNRLKSEKVDCGGFLESQAHGGITNTPDALRAAEYLVSAAYKLAGIRVYPPHSYTDGELAMMSGNEINRKNQEEPGFADTWARYRESKRGRKL